MTETVSPLPWLVKERLRILQAHARRDRSAPHAAPARRLKQANAAFYAKQALSPLTLEFPEQLPVSQRKEAIMAAIAKAQVVIVSGETGSGKTTQLPKMCLALGRGVAGIIGHTQPRRIAALSVAKRLSAELGRPLGEIVGTQIRFKAQMDKLTHVKVMTDGILLAELHGDPKLLQYDTLIIDEAHERSLTIDFLLGYVKQLLPQRPDLKVIITSATLDVDKFSAHFSQAPILGVEGKSWPIETVYSPRLDARLERPDPLDLPEAVVQAILQLDRVQRGDILVFLSGEQEIRDVEKTLLGMGSLQSAVLPLYARLPLPAQTAIFEPHHQRRIILATNIAETSLTVPGVRHVIDTGFARMHRYLPRTRLQSLKIEPISQAAADQRKGRCGRLGPGICIRLYSQEDYLSRPRFTDPEILRTHLASLLLKMHTLHLGEPMDFPFIDPPERRRVNEGVALLEELGALDRSSPSAGAQRGLTPLGAMMAKFPIDPRLSRALIEASRLGAYTEVQIIVAALSIEDPRERGLESDAPGKSLHARFHDPSSDFLSFLRLWQYLDSLKKALSGSKFRQRCKAESLNFLRILEWTALIEQLQQVGDTLGFTHQSTPANSSVIHCALLSGFLSCIGQWDPRAQKYKSASGGTFKIHPGSNLSKRAPLWILAGERVDTTQAWGRMVAGIEPEWIERQGAHLLKLSYGDPVWLQKKAGVYATAKGSLGGLTIFSGRRVYYGQRDPKLSKELFIRHALVAGEWASTQEFLEHNRALREALSDAEAKVRSRAFTVSDESLTAWYSARIPDTVVSGPSFLTWWSRAALDDPKRLHLSEAALGLGAVPNAAEYPDTWSQQGESFALQYQFVPGDAMDGVTLQIPQTKLSRVCAEAFEWHLPAYRSTLIVALIRALPKTLRVALSPAKAYAAAFLARTDTESRLNISHPLLPTLSRVLFDITGVKIPESLWDWSEVPGHLRLRFEILSPDGRVLAQGRSLHEVRQPLQPIAPCLEGPSLPQLGYPLCREGTTWVFEEIPTRLPHPIASADHWLYPALEDRIQTVGMALCASPEAQGQAMRRGILRLLLLTLPDRLPSLWKALPIAQKTAIAAQFSESTPIAISAALKYKAISALMQTAPLAGLVWTAASFRELQLHIATQSEQAYLTAMQLCIEASARIGQLQKALQDPAKQRRYPQVCAHISQRLARLCQRDWMRTIPLPRLKHYPRYLDAYLKRLEKYPKAMAQDQRYQSELTALTLRYQQIVSALPEERGLTALDDLPWMLEELHVSYFAQALGTAYPISARRIEKALEAVGGSRQLTQPSDRSATSARRRGMP